MNSVKSCPTEQLMGCQVPSVRIAPESIYSDGEDAVKILSLGKLIVDPWQSNVLCDWMGRTDEDVWSAPTCGLSVPRQNGKTCDTAGRIAAGMPILAEQNIEDTFPIPERFVGEGTNFMLTVQSVLQFSASMQQQKDSATAGTKLKRCA